MQRPMRFIHCTTFAWGGSRHQAANHRSSGLAIAAMTLLLAVCGWIVVESREFTRRWL